MEHVLHQLGYHQVLCLTGAPTGNTLQNGMALRVQLTSRMYSCLQQGQGTTSCIGKPMAIFMDRYLPLQKKSGQHCNSTMDGHRPQVLLWLCCQPSSRHRAGTEQDVMQAYPFVLLVAQSLPAFVRCAEVVTATEQPAQQVAKAPHIMRRGIDVTRSRGTPSFDAADLWACEVPREGDVDGRLLIGPCTVSRLVHTASVADSAMRLR